MIRWILHYPRLVVAVNLIITLFFAFQIPKAILDNDVANFIPMENPARKAYSEVEDVYGGQMFMLAALYRPLSTVLEPDFLKMLDELTQRLEALPFVDDVTSLTNSDYITSEGESIVVTKLLPDDFTGSPEEVEAVRARLASWDLYQNTILNKEGSAVQIIIRIGVALSVEKGVDPKISVYQGVLKALDELVPADTQSFVSGTPAMSALMSSSMQSDLRLLIPLVVIILVLSLFLSFRKLGGIALPLLSVIVSSIWSIGLMALLGVKLTMIATVIPVIMVAVGSAYGIHIITHYYEELKAKGNLDKASHKELLAETLSKIGMPVMLAALTTIAGFGSLSFTEILPVRDFGIYSSFGVLAALVTSLTLIPALLVWRGPAKVSTPKKPERYDRFSALISKVFGGLNRRPILVLALSGAVLLGSVWGMSRLIVDNALVEYFQPDTEIVKSDVFLNTRFAGTKTFSLVFQGQSPGDLTNPRILGVMADTANYIEENFPSVGKVMGYHQLIQRINQVFNADQPPEGVISSAPAAAVEETPSFGFDFAEVSEPVVVSIAAPQTARLADIPRAELASKIYKALSEGQTDASRLARGLLSDFNIDGASYYEIPRDPARYGQMDEEGLKGVIANYLLLISSGTEEWSDDALEPTQARLNVQLNSVGNAETSVISEKALAFARERLPEGYTVKAAGVALIEKAITDLLVTTQAWNIIQSLGAVFLILLISNRSLAAGFLGVIPLGIAILANFAFMGIFGIKLNMGTAMVASIAIGVGIDYTIHFLSALRWEAARNTDWDHVVQRSLMTSGKAIIFNAVSVGAGFFVLILSRFQPLIYLGLLITITMITTSIASMTLLPVLLKTFRPKFLFPKVISTRRNS